jgi:uncharacterized protein (TIGR03382 family)
MNLFGHHNRADSHGQIQTDTPVQAPELNASEGFTAVLLLAGLLAVLMGRRRVR